MQHRDADGRKVLQGWNQDEGIRVQVQRPAVWVTTY